MTCNRIIIINQGKVVAMDTPEGLTHQAKGAEKITLTVAGPSEAICEKFKTVDGVLGVQAENTNEGLVRLIVESKLDSDLRPILAAVVVKEGWKLFDLRDVSMSLEDVFINLVTKEEHV
jgi:ABC-2 type transport system ATP-binding protein